MSEKTEKPTPKKLSEARKGGQIPRSRILSAAVVTLGGILGLVGSVNTSATRLRNWTEQVFLQHDTSMEERMGQALRLLALVSAPVLGGALVAALLVSVAMAGFQFEPSWVAPKFERVDPFKGLKRLFSIRAVLDVGKGLLFVAVVAFLFWKAVPDVVGQQLRSLSGTGGHGMVLGWESLKGLLLSGACIAALLGAADYVLQRRRHIKDLMMSREDLKQEYKQSEGDPHHKGHRRVMHQQLAQSGPARGVKHATAIVVNPTHIAVALRYDVRESDVPYIVAKGSADDALAIRREARQHRIPIVRDIPLARSLIHYDVGEEIPEELYEAAAAVLRTAMEQNGQDASKEHSP